MAQLRVHPDRLEVHLTLAEKSLALRWRDVVIPRNTIRSVTITEDAWVWLRGIRAPGTEIPLLLAIGTWKFHGGKDFVLIKGKSRSAVVLDLMPDAASQVFSRVILTTPHAPALVAALEGRGGEEVFTVAEDEHEPIPDKYPAPSHPRPAGALAQTPLSQTPLSQTTSV